MQNHVRFLYEIMGKGIYSLLFLVFLCVSISTHAIECRFDTVRVTLKSATGESAVDAVYASDSKCARDIVSVPDNTDGAVIEPVGVDNRIDLFLKTNLLYDVAAVPNIGIEAAFGGDWSVGANWMHAWWSRSSAHRYWRIYGGDIELRRWLHHRNDRSTHIGHYLGFYGQILSYDIEFGGRGRQSDGLNWGVGVEYGYSLPLSRYFNLDFTIGIGYLGGRYRTYEPADDCYIWQKTSKRNWVGPTKAEISLVWIIGGRRKGGAQ